MVLWLFRHGIMPLYTPLSGSWLNMAESIQRIVVWRALSGHHPKSPTEIIDWLETTANSWNQHPTPFVWGGHRAARRIRSRARRHALGGSGACNGQPPSYHNRLNMAMSKPSDPLGARRDLGFRPGGPVHSASSSPRTMGGA